MGSDLDLVILDVMLPGRSGLEVLREIRTVKPALPVIMLTARAEVADKVAGLDAGATDYMTKPFSVEELLARVRAHLRTPAQAETTRLRVAGIELDLLRRTVTRDGTPVHLSAKEFDLLAYFMRHPGQVLSREQILNGVWDYDHDPGTNVVEVYVGYLRRKLGARRPAGADPDRALGGLPARGRLMGLRGLRPRVTLLIVAVVVVCVGIAFAAVYAGTASELSKRSRQDLRADMAALEQVGDHAARRDRRRSPRAPAPTSPTSRSGPPATSSSSCPAGGAPVTNEPELLGLSPPDERRERARSSAQENRAGARLPGRAARLQLPPACPTAVASQLLVRDRAQPRASRRAPRRRRADRAHGPRQARGARRVPARGRARRRWPR